MHRELRFHEVDSLGLAAIHQEFEPCLVDSLVVQRLGPLLETFHLLFSGVLPTLPKKPVATQPVAELIKAIQRGRNFWSGPNQMEQVGVIRVQQHTESYKVSFLTFLGRANTAGQRVAGLTKGVSNMFIAAMRELESNISEHAQAGESGLVAFRAARGVFEFVVADLGIGILESLRSNRENVNLRDHGTALHAALTDGVSRHGPSEGRGFGFRPLFQGLVDHVGELRFRSGDHALTIESTSPELANARIVQKSRVQGFLASVRCTT